MTLCFIYYQTLYLNSLTEYGLKYNPQTEKEYLENLPSSFLNDSLLHLMQTLRPPGKKSVHKIARQELEGFSHLLKMYITCVTNADLSEEAILDRLTHLSWYIHRFWKSLVRHIFLATN